MNPGGLERGLFSSEPLNLLNHRPDGLIEAAWPIAESAGTFQNTLLKSTK